MDHKETVCEDVEWIQLAKEGQVPVVTSKEHGNETVPKKKEGNVLTG
jgi:hypothetical protein